jgi:hypothetical protein
MKSIKIKFVKKGMVTATEVKDRMGRTLLASDEPLTVQKLKTLKAWGITEINVKTPDEPEEDSKVEGPVTVKAPPEIIKEQEILFKYADRRHPAVAELYEVCLARKVQMRQEEQ